MRGWELWIAAALVLAGGELLHGSLVLLAAAIACIPAGVASALGASAVTQILFFGVALLVEFPLLARLSTLRTRRRLSTNAEAIVGRRVKVLQPVHEHEDGVVLLTGEHWKARSLAGDIAAGSEAQVIQRDGLCLLVVPLERS